MIRSGDVTCGAFTAFALVLLSGSANAQGVPFVDAPPGVALVERARVQAGVVTELRPGDTRLTDFHADALPELALLWGGKRLQLTLTYTFTFALHTEFPTQIGNALALAGIYAVSPRTTLTFSASGAQSTLNNLLQAQPVTTNVPGLTPISSTTVITGNANQGLSYEVSPRVLALQHTSLSAFTTLAPALPLDTFSANEGGSLERIFKNDAVGAEADAGYFITRVTPPAISQDYILATTGPRWRHDWSPSISSTVAGGVGLLDTTNVSTPVFVYPFATATAFYAIGNETAIDLTVATRISPNPLTGQATQTYSATLHGVTPVSRRFQVFAGGSIGIVRGKIIDRINRNTADTNYTTGLADAELTWRPHPQIEMFARYTFFGQLNDATDLLSQSLSPSFLRDSVLLGISLTSRGPDARGGSAVGELSGITSNTPLRVDQTPGAGPVDATGNITNPNADTDPNDPNAGPPEGVGGSRWLRTPPKKTDDDQKNND